MPAQYRALWSVPGGGGGFTVLHMDVAGGTAPAQLIADQVRTFFLALAGIIPDDVNIDFDTEVVDMDANGVLTGAWPVTPPTQVGGSSTGTYARAQGARIDWSTPVIVAGRRLRGRTYIVPIVGTSFDTQGLLTSSAITTLTNAANGLIANLNTNAGRSLEVWSRTHAIEEDVDGASVPPAGAILRSRRD